MTTREEELPWVYGPAPELTRYFSIVKLV